MSKKIIHHPSEWHQRVLRWGILALMVAVSYYVINLFMPLDLTRALRFKADDLSDAYNMFGCFLPLGIAISLNSEIIRAQKEAILRNEVEELREIVNKQ